MSIEIRPNPASAGSATGGLTYEGPYNVTTNNPDLTSSVKGNWYLVNPNAGTLAGVSINVGDHIVFNQDASSPITSAMFDVIDNTDAVASVNGQTGVVSLTASDVSALATANNLSDLPDKATARTNLQLGTSATLDVGTSASEVVQLTAAGKYPAVDGSLITNITATDSTRLLKSDNLSDLPDKATARTNLQLGTSATLDVGTSASEVVQLTAAGKYPAVDGSLITNITATDSTRLLKSDNLSDLPDKATARTNLQLGTSATLDVGTSASEVVQFTAAGKYPAVDGSLITNITATDSTRLLKSDNLSDLPDKATARTNLQLGTSATLDVGTSASEVVQFTAAGKYPAVDGSLITNITATDSTRLLKSDNLSDLPDKATARTNLQLGTSATLDVGTSASEVVQFTAAGKYPAVDGSLITNITATDSTRLLKSDNLSDLPDKATARTNLQLGTSATLDVGTSASEVVQLTAASKLPAVDGSLLTNVTGTDATKLAIASNLSDLNNAGTARTNLGLGTAATKDTGTSNGNVVLLDATGLPAVDGSQLTGVTGTDATKLAIASNLSDLNNVGTARTNLGLGTSATIDVGTGASEVVQLTAASKLPAVDGSLLTNVTSTAAAPTVISDSSGTDTTISTKSGIEEVHLISNGAAAVVITIPTASTVGSGYKYNIKRLGSANVTVQSASISSGNNQIDGSNSYVIENTNESVTLVSNGTTYFII